VEPLLQVSELRSIAGDRLWMSPQYRRDTLAIHFTWKPVDVGRVLERLEDALAPFEARPHWGKVFHARGVGARYERMADFAAPTAGGPSRVAGTASSSRSQTSPRRSSG